MTKNDGHPFAQYRRSFLKTVGSASGLSLFAGVGAASSHTDSDPIEIDSCTTITEPGTYVLTSDILDTPGLTVEDPEEEEDSNACIHIESSDVVLDGAGHTIDGVSNQVSAGVLLSPNSHQTNVTIRNLTVTDWEFGIGYINASDGLIQNVTAENNFGIGMAVFSSTNTSITDNTVSNNSEGITLFEASDNTLSGNLVQENDAAGIALVSESNGNELLNNTIEDTVGTVPEGFEEVESAGIFLSESNHNTLRENTANTNGNDGIHINNTCNTDVIRNTANDNADNGIEVVDSTQTLLEENTATGNGGEDILITDSPDTIQTG